MVFILAIDHIVQWFTRLQKVMEIYVYMYVYIYILVAVVVVVVVVVV